MKGIPDYIKNIDKLIVSTKGGKLAWVKQNPSTYYFSAPTSSGDKTIVSLQVVEDSYFPGNFLVLQIVNTSTKETVLSLDSAMVDLQNKLAELYEEVSFSFEKKGLIFSTTLLETFNLTKVQQARRYVIDSKL